MAPWAVFLAPGAYRVQLVAIHQRPQPLRLAVAADHDLGVDREGEAALPWRDLLPHASLGGA